jgi:hypothetical protein
MCPCATGTNFVPTITTMVLILCNKVQKFEFFYENATVGLFLRSREVARWQTLGNNWMRSQAGWNLNARVNQIKLLHFETIFSIA